MDPATLIGLLLAFGTLALMVILEGGSFASILLPAPIILVLGATIAVGIASSTLKDFVLAVKHLPRAFHGKTVPPQQTIERIVELATVARRDGLLAMEQEADAVDDPFLRGALQNVADGMDAEELRLLLEDEIATNTARDAISARFFTTMGGYAPTIGIVGTVVSLTHVLDNLSRPEELGHMIAAAFVATLWGLLSANFMWLPIGTRLRRLSELEQDRMNLVLEGVLAVQAGSQPRVLGERLWAMVPDRASPQEGKAA